MPLPLYRSITERLLGLMKEAGALPENTRSSVGWSNWLGVLDREGDGVAVPVLPEGITPIQAWLLTHNYTAFGLYECGRLSRQSYNAVWALTGVVLAFCVKLAVAEGREFEAWPPLPFDVEEMVSLARVVDIPQRGIA